MKTAVIYTRVSSKEQVAGTSLDTQLAECRRFAERNNFDIMAVYTDAGLSAKTADNRPALQKALQHCLKRKISALIVYKVDRLSRNTGDGIAIREMLKRGGCEVVSATEGFTADPLGDAMSSILLTFAQLDNSQRAIRCRTGMEETALRGGWCHKAPFGFVRTKSPDGLPILVPDTAGKALQIILKDYAHGRITKRTYYTKCAAIGLTANNADRLPEREIYAGIIRETLTGGQPVKAAFEGLITYEELLAIKRRKNRLNRRVGKFTGDQFEDAYKGLIRCTCGQALTPYTSKKRRYWRCSKCRKPNMAQTELNRLITEILDSSDYLADLLKAAVTYARVSIKREIENRRKLYAAQAKEGEKATNRLNRLTDLYIDGKIDQKTFDQKAEELRAAISRSNAEKIDFEIDINRHITHIEKVAEKLENTRIFVETLTPERAHTIIEYLFGYFEVQPNKTIKPRSNQKTPTLNDLINPANADITTKKRQAPTRRSSSVESFSPMVDHKLEKFNRLGELCEWILAAV